jgi:hypothetical protein
MPVLERNLPQIEAQATAFIGTATLPPDFTIHLVCGMHSDGFGFSADGELRLFINLSAIKPDFLPSLLRHELWHIAFRNKYPTFAKSHETSTNPMRRLAYIILNEGVGHYYSFQRRVEPTIDYDDWLERTDKVFSALSENTKRLGTLTQVDDQQELLFSSHSDVPFWEKWGALPGAIITYRMKKTLGSDAMLQIITDGPCSFLTRYQVEAAKQPSWQPIPAKLLTATCS